MPDPKPIRDNWWRRFFESEESLDLSFFPDERETAREIRGLEKLLALQPDDLIADVCCGYGRHTLGLLEKGYQVVSLDASEMMLRGASKVLQASGHASRLVRGDAAALPFRSESLDVVVNLFNSFGYFLAEGQNVAVLREAARVLKPGGRFLLDTRNRQYQILYAPYHQLVTTSDDKQYLMRCHYHRELRRLDSRWSLPDDPDTIIHEASIRLYGVEELQELITGVGLEVTGIYGNYFGEDFEGWQRQLLFVCRKN